MQNSSTFVISGDRNAASTPSCLPLYTQSHQRRSSRCNKITLLLRAAYRSSQNAEAGAPIARPYPCNAVSSNSWEGSPCITRSQSLECSATSGSLYSFVSGIRIRKACLSVSWPAIMTPAQITRGSAAEAGAAGPGPDAARRRRRDFGVSIISQRVAERNIRQREAKVRSVSSSDSAPLSSETDSRPLVGASVDSADTSARHPGDSVLSTCRVREDIMTFSRCLPERILSCTTLGRKRRGWLYGAWLRATSPKYP
mmetsp:Transcript_37329/g.89772  ORF Transcript_37329/g.89772 Transcript_37329/m.89772 type:complete len:255 (+) Transcript_37329:2516-3280(+)